MVKRCYVEQQRWERRRGGGGEAADDASPGEHEKVVMSSDCVWVLVLGRVRVSLSLTFCVRGRRAMKEREEKLPRIEKRDGLWACVRVAPW